MNQTDFMGAMSIKYEYDISLRSSSISFVGLTSSSSVYFSNAMACKFSINMVVSGLEERVIMSTPQKLILDLVDGKWGGSVSQDQFYSYVNRMTVNDLKNY